MDAAFNCLGVCNRWVAKRKEGRWRLQSIDRAFAIDGSQKEKKVAKKEKVDGG